MSKGLQVWLGLLSAVVVILATGLIVGLSALNADVAQLDTQVASIVEPGRAPEPGQPAPALDARVVSTSATTSTFVVTLSVRFAGPADLLAEPPVLQAGNGAVYPARPASLEQARFAFLDLVASGQATTGLVFEGAPDPKQSLKVVFNPGRRAGDAIAPRREVEVR